MDPSLTSPTPPPPPRSVIIIGGGIAGLAAARAVASGGVPSITVLEASSTLGGKLRTIRSEDGIALETGADSFLAAKPAAADLAGELGLELVAPGPAAKRTYLLLKGRLRLFPSGLAMGVPTGIAPMVDCVRHGLISPLGAARAALEPLLPHGPDRRSMTVAQVMHARLGRQVTDRLIAPLTTGVFGAPPDELGFVDALPHLADARSLVLAMARRPKAAANAPTFLTVRDGLQRMVQRLVDTLQASGVIVRTNTQVEQVTRGQDGVFSVHLVDGRLNADAIIIATPAPNAAAVAGDLLHSSSSAALAGVQAHPSATVLLRYPAGGLTRPLDASGYLVAPTDRRAVAACTWLPAKWPHHAWGDPWIRAIVTDPEPLSLDDDVLIGRVADEVGCALGSPSLNPTSTILHRWEAAIPVYGPGHRTRMAAVLASLPTGLALAGAAYRGPGIPDCISSGIEAAQRVLTEPAHTL